jgi:hypothetical protein
MKTTIENKIKQHNGEATVKFSEWKSGKGQMPKQAAKCVDPFEMKVNGVPVKVYHNRSKSGVAYFYAQDSKGTWRWTRDEVDGGEYETYVKPKTEKPAVTEAASK